MNVDWDAVLVFLAGGVAGSVFSAFGQVVVTRLTREKHSLTAKFVPYRFMGVKDRKNHEYSRGIVLRNNGNFVERDVEVRLKFLKNTPSLSYSINISLPDLIQMTSTSEVAEEHKRHLLGLEVESTYMIEYLSPRESVRFDLATDIRLVEIHFSAVTTHAVTRLYWAHANYKVMYAESMEHIYGPPTPPPEDEDFE